MKDLGRRSLPALAGCLLTVLVWVVFTWPLPRFATEGIPASAGASCGSRVRSMIAGDHLQLQYRFWLFHDMLRGETPWFKNIYEFNAGPDDETMIKPGSWYFPFSLLYAVFAQAGGRALAWNLTGLVSLLLTLLFTRSLVKRYVRDEWVAIPAALIAVAMPYRYEALLGGSPAGFAMMWVPMLFLGIDIAVRDGRVAGGLLAGTALLFTALTDTQIFFFSALASPAWGFIAILNSPLACCPDAKNMKKLLLALLPAALLAGAAVLFAFWSKAELVRTAQSAARSIQEARDCAPAVADFFAVQRRSAGAPQVYLGWIPLLLIAAAAVAAVVRLFSGRPVSMGVLATIALLSLGIALIVVLALGPSGPGKGGLYLLCRKLIPPYAMVRQTAKIMCVLPPVMALAAALSWSVIAPLAGRAFRALVIVAAIVLAAEYSSHLRAEICLLAQDQKAYGSVVDDANASGRIPRAMALPLWPGDSHWSSLYEHYSSLYRIRMVNGYRPVVNAAYYRDVFEKFRSLNSGKIDDEQLDQLLSRGVTHLVLHEDALPEKVSPFPVGLTLKKLLNNPRLSLLADEGGVWAFRILKTAETRSPACEKWNVFFPARYFEAERCSLKGGAVAQSDPGCSEGAYVKLSEPGSFLRTASRGMVDAPSARWMIRARGKGSLDVEICDRDAVSLKKERLPVTTDEWQWLECSLPLLPGYAVAGLTIASVEGGTDVDMVLLAAGSWSLRPADAGVHIPPPCFFHAGYTRLETDSVVMRRQWQPDSNIFYGPRLPLEPGKYVVVMRFTSSSAGDTLLGRWNASVDGSSAASAAVTNSGECRLPFEVQQNTPVMFSFEYSGRADIEITDVEIARVGQDDGASADRLP